MLRPCIRLAFIMTLALTLTSCQAHSLESRLSAAVSFPEATQAHENFLQSPELGYIEGYIRFDPSLGEDVIIVIDQEFIEGTTNPLWVSGGDWMALAGVQRNGAVWIAGGFDEAFEGKSSQEKGRNWKIEKLPKPLLPDTWYRLEVVADFSTRHFVSFTIEGPDISKSFDLKDVQLDYPNYMPFDTASMAYFVGAMRGRDMMKDPGTSVVYFDDVNAGILNKDGTKTPLFSDSFENLYLVEKQPISNPLRLSAYQRNRWYLENENALFSIMPSEFARTGKNVGVADVRLEK
jgi:hypothetical protein